MTEKVEVTQSNGEKQKKILSLKMLDEVKDDKWKYGYKLSNWNNPRTAIWAWRTSAGPRVARQVRKAQVTAK